MTPGTPRPAAAAEIFQPRVLSMLFLGFSAGIPLLLIFSSLSLWLREAGLERSAVTMFSWAALGYGFKFVWAPLIDQLPLPLLTRWLGQRRSWLLVAQLAIAAAILAMSSTDPAGADYRLAWLAAAAVMLGFSAATQDIVIDAYRIESARPELQALMSATYVAGYRVGMVVSGAGSLYLADWFGSSSGSYDFGAWRDTYRLMACVMGVGIVTTLLVREPERPEGQVRLERSADYLRFVLVFLLGVSALIAVYVLSSGFAAWFKAVSAEWIGNQALAGLLVEVPRLALALAAALASAQLLVRFGMVPGAMVERTYLRPVKDFFQRYGLSLALWLLLLIGFYRISDIVLGVVSNVFYQDMGYSKIEIANASKFFGLIMTILGGFVGGLMALRFGVIRVLLIGAVLAAVTNLLFMLLAMIGYDLFWLYLVISIDNLSAGIASAAFVAFLSSLTNVSFTAMQYAIFSSLFALVPKGLGGYSGAMVDALGYPVFFLVTTLLGVPVLLLVAGVARRLEIKPAQ